MIELQRSFCCTIYCVLSSCYSAICFRRASIWNISVPSSTTPVICSSSYRGDVLSF